MDFSWFNLSFVVSLLAIWIAFSDYRRNNFAIIRVRESSWCFTRSIEENATQPFYYLKIVIQNLGIPLYKPNLTLSFSNKDGAGRVSFPLKGTKHSTAGDGP